MAWNTGLTGQGLNIAEATNEKIRVMAGPGAGKSFSLMRRIARLLEEGVDPERILLVTFTRTAAQDLKNDLLKLDCAGAELVKAGTLHSFCFKILSKAAVFQVTGRKPRPLFKFEESVLESDLSKLLGSIGIREVKRKINAFNAAWATTQNMDPGWPTDSAERSFHRELVRYLKDHGSMLIGEVVPEVLKYLRNNPTAEEFGMFDYIFVDEYQDLNKAEQEVINLLGTNAQLMVIGDEDQSIYQSFRHANPEGIREFHLTHSETQDYSLDECRRCPQLIVRVANTFIQNNENREARVINPRSENIEGNIYPVQWNSFEDEILGITQYVIKRVESGVPLGEILILSPRRELGYQIRNQLNTMGLEAHSFFTEEYFDSDESKAAMSYLNLLVNPEDKIALRVLLSLGLSHKNSAGYLRILEYVRATGESLFKVLDQLKEGEISIKHSRGVLDKYILVKEKLNELQQLDLNDLIESLFPSTDAWALPFLEIIEGSDLSDVDSLGKVLLEAIVNPATPMGVDFIRIMSIHKSKGLSADVVIVTGLVQGLIPRLEKGATDEEKSLNLEEQRRLFYVGITRPKKELLISSVANIPKKLAYEVGLSVPRSDSGNMRAIASSFLPELGPELPRAITGQFFLESL